MYCAYKYILYQFHYYIPTRYPIMFIIAVTIRDRIIFIALHILFVLKINVVYASLKVLCCKWYLEKQF